uniref:Portal protein n=1 Tax=Pseudomonas phage HRDY3 TaxID=3236930 RepID=A0AB39CDH7_9VIRU
MNFELAVAAVSMRTALKYRRNWNKQAPAVKLLQSMMPKGPGKKGYRLYFDIGQQHKSHFTIPPAVRSALQRAGYVATDYLAKKCVKITDKEQKNVTNIGKVIAKDPHAKTAFDNDPQLQNTKGGSLQVVISCHPYDIIGMSTGRDWDLTSCMRLADGEHRLNPGINQHYVKNDVAEGTLVAYVVSSDDKNIQKPKARCLLKPFINGKGDVLYRRETRVYGNPVPGFDLVLARFLRQINMHIPSDEFRMAETLYDDGMGGRFTHEQSTDDNLSAHDALMDTELAIDYIRQRVVALKNAEGPEEKQHIAQQIFHYIDSNEAEKLHDTQIDEIVEALKGVPEMADEFNNQATSGTDLRPVPARIGREIGAFEGFQNLDMKTVSKLPLSLVSSLSIAGGPVMAEMLERVQAMVEHSNLTSNSKVFRMIMTGVYPVPPKEVLEKLPRVGHALYTMACAARHMLLLDDTSMQKAAYEILDMNLDFKDPERSEEMGEMIYQSGGTNLSICYNIDNLGKLDSNVLWVPPTGVVANALTRKAFRLLDKFDSDGRVEMWVDEIKKSQVEQLLYDQGKLRDYKDFLPRLRDWLNDNTEVVQQLVNQWQPKYVKALAEFNLPSVMHLTDNGIIFGSQTADTINAIIPSLLAWEGEPLIPESQDMVEICQLIVAAGNLLEKPLHLEKKFDSETFEEGDLLDVAEHFQTGMGRRRHQRTTTFGALLNKIVINGEKPDITYRMDLVENNGADGIGWVAPEKLPLLIRKLLKMVANMDSLDTAILALTRLVHNSDMIQPVDVQEEVNNRMDMGAVQYPDEDEMEPEAYQEALEAYEENRQRIEDEVEAQRDKTLELNEKLLEVLEKIADFVGMDDFDESTDDDEAEAQPFDVETPNIRENQWADQADEVHGLRREIYDAQQTRPDELEEYRDRY